MFSKVKISRKIALLWTIVVIIGSLLPSAFVKIQALDSISGSDKFLHLSMYAVASFLWLAGLKDESSKLNKYFVVVLILSSMGLVIEVLQVLITVGRFFEWYDALANFAGTIFGALFFAVLNMKMKNN